MSSVKPLPLPPYSKGPRWALLFLGFVALVLLAGAGVYAYLVYIQPQQSTSQDEKVVDDSLVAKIGNLIELPDEEPTIATVSDVTQLKDQEFFANAQNGDKVLIFQKSGKAILYRPSTEKIIEVGPVTIELPTNTATSSATIAMPLGVVLYNGSTVVGITQTVEDQITETYEKIEVLERENAKGNYDETIVVDLTRQRASDAQLLADLIGGKVGQLPDTEASPEAEILIIVGESYSEE